MKDEKQFFYTMDEIYKSFKRNDDAKEGEPEMVFADGVPFIQQMKINEIIGRILDGSMAEQGKDLETAYTHYKAAADLGSVDAMRMIGNLYYHEKYHPVTVSAAENMLRKMLQARQTVFMPHDMAETVEPDYKTAFEWYRKAAEQGDTESLHNTGVMLIAGCGCQKDPEQAKGYFQKAMKRGYTLSFAAYKEYFGEDGLTIEYKTDDEYAALLADFEQKADQSDPRAFDVYNTLTLGTDSQRAKLGYAIAKGKYNVGGLYEKFGFPARKTGEPYAPVYFYNRMDWVTYVKIDLNAFREETVVLSVASDLEWIGVKPARWIKEEGSIAYTSGAFGFLGEEKKGIILKVDKAYGDTFGSLQTFPLHQHIKDELAAANVTLFSENGEKEYSVEICQIIDGRMIILYRYTIDKYGKDFDQGDRASVAKRLT